MRTQSFLILFLLMARLPAFAETVKTGWTPIPGAEIYEYEISEGANFDANNLVRQGTSKVPSLETDLRPGNYQLRIRALGAEGRPGKWTSPTRIFVKSSPPEFRSPKKGEALEISSATTPVFFEWTTVPGAQDYEVKLQGPGGKNLTKIVLNSIAQFEGLSTGGWQIKVLARTKGQPITETESIPFTISVKSLPQPRFLHPLNNDALTAWELIRLRWTRLVPGLRSEVIVTRMNPEPLVISREEVFKDSETWIPALAPGRYQVTIHDFVNESAEHSDNSITIVVEEDPMGYHSKFIGTTWRWIGGGADFLGSIKQRNDQMKPLPDGLLSPTTAPKPVIESRIQSKIWSPWGAEFSYSMFLGNLSYPDLQDPAPTRLSGPLRRFKMGPTYKIEPLGPTKPLLFKALLGYSWFNLSTSGTHSPNFDLLSLFVGSEIRWGGWNSRYDLLGEFQLGLPLLTSSGRTFGRGNPTPIPSLHFNVYARRRIGESSRLLIGCDSHLEYISISEGPFANNQVRTVKTHWRRMSFGPRLAFEWDL